MTRPVRSHFAVGSLVFKWAGRISALVLLVLWSLFFGKHVHEWYLQPGGAYPPAWVLAVMIFHLTMLVGLLVSLRWSWLGSAMTIVSTAAFIACAGIWARPPVLLLVNIAPALCFTLAWLLGRFGCPPTPRHSSA